MDSQERRKDFCSISLAALLVLLFFFFHRLDLPLLFLHHHQISTCRPSPPPKYQGGPSVRVRPPTQNVVHRRGPATHSIADISWPLPVGGPTDGRTDAKPPLPLPQPNPVAAVIATVADDRPPTDRPPLSFSLSLLLFPSNSQGRGSPGFMGELELGRCRWW